MNQEEKEEISKFIEHFKIRRGLNLNLSLNPKRQPYMCPTCNSSVIYGEKCPCLKLDKIEKGNKA